MPFNQVGIGFVRVNCSNRRFKRIGESWNPPFGLTLVLNIAVMIFTIISQQLSCKPKALDNRDISIPIDEGLKGKYL